MIASEGSDILDDSGGVNYNFFNQWHPMIALAGGIVDDSYGTDGYFGGRRHRR